MIPTSPRLIEYMTNYGVLPLSTDTKDTKIVMSRWNEGVNTIGLRLNQILREACINTGAQCGMDVRVHDQVLMSATLRNCLVTAI